MLLSEVEAIEVSRKKLQRVSHYLSLAFLMLFWCVVIIGCIILFASIGVSVDATENCSMLFLLAPLKLLIEVIVISFIIWVARSVFRDISDGVSPFTPLQAKRMKIASLLQVVHAAFVTVSSPVFLQVTGIGDSMLGVSVGEMAISTTRTIPVNVGDIVLAIVLFCAALIVEYGSLLQQLSDDTV